MSEEIKTIRKGKLFSSIEELMAEYKTPWWKEKIYYPVYRLWHRGYDKVRYLFYPQNKTIRKAVPRHWSDITELMVEVNFAMIAQFYEDEYLQGFIDWDYDEAHRNFASWLQNAYAYIKVGRPALEQAKDKAYPDYRAGIAGITKGKSYQELYEEVDRLEEQIEETDTKVIKEFVENRKFFWT